MTRTQQDGCADRVQLQSVIGPIEGTTHILTASRRCDRMDGWRDDSRKSPFKIDGGGRERRGTRRTFLLQWDNEVEREPDGKIMNMYLQKSCSRYPM